MRRGRTVAPPEANQEQRPDGGAERSAAELAAGRLPLAAQERIERLRSGSAFTSDLSTAAFAALQGVGLDPVGQVMGSCVWHLGRWTYTCGAVQATGLRGGQVSGVPATARPVSSYQASLERARKTALRRLRQECAALGGDGVVNVRLGWSRFAGVNRTHEFTATGTAVRARSRVRPRVVFTTTLPGPDVASLLRSGWTPCGVAYGISVAARHDDWRTKTLTTGISRATVEVPGYTDLVGAVRAWSRRDFAAAAAGTGADGAILTGQELQVWKNEAGGGHTDHLAIATLVGTSVARVRHHSPRPGPGRSGPAVLSVLSLSPESVTTRTP